MSFTQSNTFSQVARRKPQGKNANQSQFCPFRAASCRSTVTQRFHRGSTDQNTNQSQFQASIQSPYNTNSKPNPISRSGGAGAPPHRQRQAQNSKPNPFPCRVAKPQAKMQNQTQFPAPPAMSPSRPARPKIQNQTQSRLPTRSGDPQMPLALSRRSPHARRFAFPPALKTRSSIPKSSPATDHPGEYSAALCTLRRAPG